MGDCAYMQEVLYQKIRGRQKKYRKGYTKTKKIIEKMAEAQALIIYGDGLQALFYDDKNPTINRQGVKVHPILIVPSEELKPKFKLTDEDLNIVTEDGKRGIWMDYPVQQIDWLNRSKTGAVLFIWCSFDGGNTPIMMKMDELLEWDKQRDKTESRLRAEVSSLSRELENITSNKIELLRQLKELEDVVKRKEEEGEEEEVG